MSNKLFYIFMEKIELRLLNFKNLKKLLKIPPYLNKPSLLTSMCVYNELL